MSTALSIPDDVSPPGRAAAQLIVDFLVAEGFADTGSSQVFYSPSQWRARGGTHARGCDLIVSHDSVALWHCFCPDELSEPDEDSEDHWRHHRLLQLLETHGFRLDCHCPEFSRVVRR